MRKMSSPPRSRRPIAVDMSSARSHPILLGRVVAKAAWFPSAHKVCVGTVRWAGEIDRLGELCDRQCAFRLDDTGSWWAQSGFVSPVGMQDPNSLAGAQAYHNMLSEVLRTGAVPPGYDGWWVP